MPNVHPVAFHWHQQHFWVGGGRPWGGTQCCSSHSHAMWKVPLWALSTLVAAKHMPPLWAHARPTNVPKSAQGGCTGTLGAMCAWVQPPATCVPTIESGHATMAPHMGDGWRCWPWPCTMGGPHARTQCLKGGWAYPEAHSQPVCQPGGTPKSGHNATLGTRPPRPPSTPVGGLGAHTCALPMCLEGLGGGALVPGQPCGAWCTAQPVGPLQVWPHLQKARLQHWWHWLACLCTQVVWHAQAWCPVWHCGPWLGGASGGRGCGGPGRVWCRQAK